MNGASGSTIEQALRASARAPGRGSERSAAAGAAARLAERIAAEGLADISYGSLESPVGPLHAALSRRGLVRIAFAEEHEQAMVEELARRLSPRIVLAPRLLDPLRRELDEYFEGRRRRFELELDWALIGPFARRVLRRTAAIPYGSHSSYGEVAAAAGSPRGARAAGNALGSNPIPIVIPCHRVLHAGGGLGGYGGGLQRKRFLLELEGALD